MVETTTPHPARKARVRLPKPVVKDYSSRPQRPIALKTDIGKLNLTQEPEPEPEPRQPAVTTNPPATTKPPTTTKPPATTKPPVTNEPARTPRPKVKRSKKTKPKARPADQWVLQGISGEARAIAERVAKQQGMKPGAWLERLIRDAAQPQPAAPVQPAQEQQLLATLAEVRERLAHLEAQRGTASQFWYWLTEWVKQLINMGR